MRIYLSVFLVFINPFGTLKHLILFGTEWENLEFINRERCNDLSEPGRGWCKVSRRAMLVFPQL